ncbi:MAG: 2TM domain-containing protein [Spirochaetes bacterium]|nr:2TM domain-containing protein [Spirochaetota bacterium]MBU0955674.1 2TM domain-containing protein [Spirochaetota bacterium]
MEQKDYRLAAIMYTDIVGFSRMMEQDEAGTLRLMSFHNKLVTDITDKYHGEVIKTIGDAFLVVFRNTVEALQSAMEIQDTLYAHNVDSNDKPLLLRIGVHLGDIYFYENDALGEGINIAARLQSFARPGTICFSQDVYNQVLNKIDFRADKLGKLSLKNINKEIHGYEIVSNNAKFDPDRDKPRPGYKPETQPTKTEAPERSYTAEESQKLIQQIRRTILEDIQNSHRRMTVDEANKRYGHYGVEAKEVIASLVEKGIIMRQGMPQPEPGTSAQPGMTINGPNGPVTANSDLARDIGKAVEGIARAIEGKVSEWQRSGKQGTGSQAQTASQQHSHSYKSDSGQNIQIHFDASKVAASIKDATQSHQSRKQALAEELKRHAREVPTGKWDSELKDSDYFKPDEGDLATDFTVYKESLELKANKAFSGFLGNLIPFIGVNIFLWFINTQFSSGFMWAAIVSAAWGIGLVANFFSLLRNKHKAAEVEKIPELDRSTLDQYKKLNRVRDSMASHTATVLTVPALLFTINLLTVPGFLWAIIPSGIIALSFLGHLAAYPGSKRSLTKKIFAKFNVKSWAELFRLKKSSSRIRAESGQYANFYEEALRTKGEITSIIKADKSGILDKDMIPNLDQYVEQVKMITHSVNEIDQIVSTIPMEELAKDRLTLSKKLEDSTSPGLQSEYRKSIAEIEKQERACRELADQKEVLSLRMRSSVNALKQLKIDMARLKTIPDASNQAAGQQIRDKASELTHYLQDLQSGYGLIGEDPFDELERLSKEREAAGLPPAGQQPAPAQLPPPEKPAAQTPQGAADRNLPGSETKGQPQ